MSHLIPSGAQTYSKTRFPSTAPRYALRAHGPWVFGDDGRAYVDAVAALGPILLGHGWPAVQAAALDQVFAGVSFSLPTELEEQLASRLVSLVPGMEMARFGKNGNDVVNAAVRIARAATGRRVVCLEEGAYHGHADWALAAPKDGGIQPCAGYGVQRFKRGDLRTLGAWMAQGYVAAIVLDPCPAHDPVIPDPEYFAAIRKLCDEHGCLLILDEMVTGFRLGWPGAVTTYGIECDLWCGAKALGNGWPITTLLGKREYMERIEGDVFYSTTFAGEAVSIAAAIACLDELESAQAYEQVTAMGTDLREAYADMVGAKGLTGLTEIVGYPSRPVFRWADPVHEAAFVSAVNSGGMLFQGYINLMVAHREAWDQILSALDRGLQAVQAIARPSAA